MMPMPNPEPQARLAMLRKSEIGRVTLYVVSGSVTHGVPIEEATSPGQRRQDPPYLLAVPMRCGLRYSQQGRAERVFGGDYVLLSQKAGFALEIERGGEALIVSIPAADLKGRVASVEEHAGRRFEPNGQMSRLLVDFLRGVAEVFSDGHPPNPEALATEIVSFIALTLGAEDRGAVIDVRNGRYHLRRRIFEFIEMNLGDQDLSPRKIAASSRISLSYLYSLFNDDDTTVGQFVQTKRLQRAYEMLVADPAGRRTVSEVAYEVGFKNVSHFSRSFSRYFQVAPRDVRQTPLLPDARVARRPSNEGGSARHPYGSAHWHSEPAGASVHG
jgi:AraC-like DNA-binding protein